MMRKVCPAATFCNIGNRRIDQLLVVTVVPDQANAGGFTEGEAEPGGRDLSDHDFIEIFHGLDEMGLTDE